MTSLADEELFSADLSSEDSFDEIQELESRLYSIIHYNNLSEIEPSDLPDGFKVDENKLSNELIISLDENKINSQIETAKTVDINLSQADNQKVISNCNNIEELSCKSNNNYENSILEVPHEDSTDDKSNLFPEGTSRLHGNTDKCFQVIEIDSDSDISVNMVTTNSTNDSISININCEETSKTVGKICSVEISDEKNKNEPRKRKKIKLKTNNEENLNRCPKKWTPSMVKFYSKSSRSKLNFDSSKLISKMRGSTRREHWFINSRDSHYLKFFGSPKQRCRRCKQLGHDVRNCVEPVKPITCYMCGEAGHRENNCHKKKCLSCGTPTVIYVRSCSKCSNNMLKRNSYCYLCNSNYHNTNMCPEIWRAFHMTTEPGPLVMPSKETLRKICCNCGKHGHFDFECSKRIAAEYVLNTPAVGNYVGVAQLLASDRDNLTLAIRWDSRDGTSLTSDSGYSFLQHLSDTSGARLELQSINFSESLQVSGSEEQCKSIIDTVRGFLRENCQDKGTSFHKHKTKSSKKKKRI